MFQEWLAHCHPSRNATGLRKTSMDVDTMQNQDKNHPQKDDRDIPSLRIRESRMPGMQGRAMWTDSMASKTSSPVRVSILLVRLETRTTNPSRVHRKTRRFIARRPLFALAPHLSVILAPAVQLPALAISFKLNGPDAARCEHGRQSAWDWWSKKGTFSRTLTPWGRPS